MGTRLKLVFLTALMLVIADVFIGTFLHLTKDKNSALDKLYTYFEYGRSVPGKLEIWRQTPGTPGNLQEVAWRDTVIDNSREQFQSTDMAPHKIRGYGMSFLNHMLEEAHQLDQKYQIDLHSGPGAPPNFVYSVFEDDRNYTNTGDIVVLGILSSSIKGMASFSNRTWVFEQPAPFTYPIYYCENAKLIRVDPIIDSFENELLRRTSPELNRSWKAQLKSHDLLHSDISHSLSALDVSPFFRLARRYSVEKFLSARTEDVLGKGDAVGRYDYNAVLKSMFTSFHEDANTKGQTPVVVLIQTLGDHPNLKKEFAPFLAENGIRYFATEDIQSPLDASGYLPDGHFTHEVNTQLAAELISIFNMEQ